MTDSGVKGKEGLQVWRRDRWFWPCVSTLGKAERQMSQFCRDINRYCHNTKTCHRDVKYYRRYPRYYRHDLKYYHRDLKYFCSSLTYYRRILRTMVAKVLKIVAILNK